MPLQTLTLAQLQQMFATNYSSVAALPANTNPGSALGAIANANALLALNIQGELVYVSGISRLATSNGADVDSFVNPFGVTRIAASPSSGTVTMSTASPVSTQVIIPIGTQVATSTGLIFTLIADPTNSTGYYNATLLAYVIAAGTTTANVLVQCTVAGSIGNVQAGTITQPYGTSATSPLAGISTISNGSAFTNGQDQETDAALRTRFALLLSTGSGGTVNALAAALLAVQPNLTYTIGDAISQAGASTPGYISVFVNVLGSSSAPSAALISAVQAAVSAPGVKPAGSTVNTYAPSIATVGVTANVKVAGGYQASSVVAAASAALATYLNSIGLSPTGATQLAQLAECYVVLRTTPGVANVTSLLLNGNQSDVSAAYGAQLVAGTITLTPY
jgi:uncharacterized phage protein gp47/JayE